MFVFVEVFTSSVNSSSKPHWIYFTLRHNSNTNRLTERKHKPSKCGKISLCRGTTASCSAALMQRRRNEEFRQPEAQSGGRIQHKHWHRFKVIQQKTVRWPSCSQTTETNLHKWDTQGGRRQKLHQNNQVRGDKSPLQRHSVTETVELKLRRPSLIEQQELMSVPKSIAA